MINNYSKFDLQIFFFDSSF